MCLLGRIFLLLLLIGACSTKTISKPIVLSNWEAPARNIIIKAHQNWWDLEQQFNVPSSILKRYNQNITLKSNQKIHIPAKQFYIVKNGETTIGIAVKHGMSFSELVYLNELHEPYKLNVGQRLKVLAAKSTKTIKIKAKPIKFQPIWPIKGNIIEKFGLQTNGKYNNELILDTNGEVKATAEGTVVYTGDEVGHYGNLIIIQHIDDWFSSYGNLTEILVKKGDVVKSGDKIATINKSPFYFGLRNGVEPVNPIKYLKKNK